MSENDGLSELFAENEELLARLASNFSQIEKGVVNAALLDELYRDTHTMKGSSQLFGFKEVGMLAHVMESSLSPVRKNQTPPNKRLLDALFHCVDVIEVYMNEAKKVGKPNGDSLRALNNSIPLLMEAASSQFGQGLDGIKDVLIQEVSLQVPNVPKDATVAAPAENPQPPASNHEADTGANKHGGESPSVGESGDTTIRVQVGVLDRLMNLVGEMVLVRNQVLQYTHRNEDLAFLNLSQRLDIVTSDLQEQVMRTRMQPIGNVVGKFQRLTRDLSRELNKQIDLTIQGKETELDRTLLEAIKDPLTHIVRNSCDHGIEAPADRKAAGKPENGHILISASHEGGQVIVEISDDGKGLDRKRILKKALEKGLIGQERASSLSDREVLSLIFLPGFSTAEKVSSVSGRGVGMDVVRTNIEKIGGSVDIESVEGKGTTIRLRIPLTLAIVPAMLVRSGKSVYAIPQVKLVELVRVELGQGQSASRTIQILQGKPVYELRGRILPLVDLENVLGVRRDDQPPFWESDRATVNIVVLNAEGEVFGLVVDEVLDTADIVVKPLGKFLKALGLYSAATILGNGNVALILDPTGIARSVHLAGHHEQEGVFSDLAHAKAENADAQEFLLFRTSGKGKYAVPLCMVNRLEEISDSEIEFSGQQPIIQYRQSILPIVNVNSALGYEGVISANQGEKIATIVVQRSGRLVGLAVNQILDVATVGVSIDDSIRDRFGILGNLIVGDEVVTVLDTLGIVEKELHRLSEVFGEPVPSITEIKGNVSAKKLRVLYAEDVAFFRNQVTKLLTAAGYEVQTAPDGKAALELLEKTQSNPYDLVLSDIEMPHMNGYSLAVEVRKMEAYKTAPLVALTTRFNQADIEKGKESGFSAYLEKLNPEILLNALNKLVNPKERGAPGAESKMEQGARK